MTLDYLSGQIEAGCGSGAIVRQLGGQPVAGAVRALGDCPDGAAVTSSSRSAIPPFRSLAFPKARAASLPLMPARPASMRSGLDETVDPLWAAKELPESCRFKAISIRSR